MKIYLASHYKRLEEMQDAKQLLELNGHNVVARWVEGEEDGKSNEDIALMDLEDVIRADMIIAFTNPFGSSNTGGGRHTEFGIGYALNKTCWIVGEREQVFHWLPEVKQFDTIQELIPELETFEEKINKKRR